MSDSSDSSSSDEEIHVKPERKKMRTHYIDDRATSKFYTKDESQEDLPYVADNIFKIKKEKKKKYLKKSSHSKDKSSSRVHLFPQYFLQLLISH